MEQSTPLPSMVIGGLGDHSSEMARRELGQRMAEQCQSPLGISKHYMDMIVNRFECLNDQEWQQLPLEALIGDELFKSEDDESIDIRASLLGRLLYCLNCAPDWWQPPNRHRDGASNFKSSISSPDQFLPHLIGRLIANLKQCPFHERWPPQPFRAWSDQTRLTSLLPLLMFPFNRPPLNPQLIPLIIQLIQTIYVDTPSSRTLTSISSLPTSNTSILSISSSTLPSTSITTPSTSIPIDDAQFALIRLVQQNPDFNSDILPLLRLLRQAGATTKFTTNVLWSDLPLSTQSSFGDILFLIHKEDTRQINSWIYLSSWMSTQKLECILKWLIQECESNPRAIMELYDPTYELDLGDGSGSQTILAYVQHLMKLHPNNTPLQIYGQLIHRLHQLTSSPPPTSTSIPSPSDTACLNDMAELDEEMVQILESLQTTTVTSSSSSPSSSSSTYVDPSAYQSHDPLISYGGWLKSILDDLTTRCTSVHLLHRLIQNIEFDTQHTNGASFSTNTNSSFTTQAKQLSRSQLSSIHLIINDVTHLLAHHPERLNFGESDFSGNCLFHLLLSIPTTELLRLRPYQQILTKKITHLPPSLLFNQPMIEKLLTTNKPFQPLPFSTRSAQPLPPVSSTPSSSSTSSTDVFPYDTIKYANEPASIPTYCRLKPCTIGQRYYFDCVNQTTTEPNTNEYEIIGLQWCLHPSNRNKFRFSVWDGENHQEIIEPVEVIKSSGIGFRQTFFERPIQLTNRHAQTGLIISMSWRSQDSSPDLYRYGLPPSQLIDQHLIRSPLEEVTISYKHYVSCPLDKPIQPTGFTAAPIIRIRGQLPPPQPTQTTNQSTTSSPPHVVTDVPPITNSTSSSSLTSTATGLFDLPATDGVFFNLGLKYDPTLPCLSNAPRKTQATLIQAALIPPKPIDGPSHITQELLYGQTLITQPVVRVNLSLGSSVTKPAANDSFIPPLDLLFSYHSPYPSQEFIWMIYDTLFTVTLNHIHITYPQVTVEQIVKENLIGHLSDEIGRWTTMENMTELKVRMDLFQSHSIPIWTTSAFSKRLDLFEHWLSNRGSESIIRQWLSTCHDSTDGLWPVRSDPFQSESLLDTAYKHTSDSISLLQDAVEKWHRVYGPIVRMQVEDHLIPDLSDIIYQYLLPPTTTEPSIFKFMQPHTFDFTTPRERNLFGWGSHPPPPVPVSTNPFSFQFGPVSSFGQFRVD